MVHFLNHYKLKTERIKSLEDVKAVLEKMDLAWTPNADIESIKHLVELELKPSTGISLL